MTTIIEQFKNKIKNLSNVIEEFKINGINYIDDN